MIVTNLFFSSFKKTTKGWNKNAKRKLRICFDNNLRGASSLLQQTVGGGGGGDEVKKLCLIVKFWVMWSWEGGINCGVVKLGFYVDSYQGICVTGKIRDQKNQNVCQKLCHQKICRCPSPPPLYLQNFYRRYLQYYLLMVTFCSI